LDKQQFNYKISSEVKQKFLDKFLRLKMSVGGGDKYEYAEAAVKAFVALPDDICDFLHRPSTSIKDAKKLFAGLENRKKILEITQNKIIEARSEEERIFWYSLNELMGETFRMP